MSIKRFRPTSGTQGESFMASFCDRCRHGNGTCRTRTNAVAFDVDDPEYPSEWCYDADGQPTCTAFVENAPFVLDLSFRAWKEWGDAPKDGSLMFVRDADGATDIWKWNREWCGETGDLSGDPTHYSLLWFM